MTTTKASEKLNNLLEHFDAIYHLKIAEFLLGWDQRTMMPDAARLARAKLDGMLAGIVHDRLTHCEIGSLIEQLTAKDNASQLDATAKAQIRESKRIFDNNSVVPDDLVRQQSECAAHANGVWIEAREKSDFKMFQPYLQKVIQLKQQEAEIRFDKCSGFSEPYECLLNDYEPGIGVALLDEVFIDVREFLAKAIQTVTAKASLQENPTATIFAKAAKAEAFTEEKQHAFGVQIIREMGFDFERGRVDKSVHPFCTGNVQDTRITTRFNLENPLSSLFAMMHEAGHGLYTQGLPAALYATPAGQFRSLGVHESQSLLWESWIGRSREFWQHALGPLQETYAPHLNDLQLDDLFAYINRVEPSFIRVDADDTTYILHIIIRYELEKLLMRGELQVGDLPDAWNDRYQSYLGIRPESDAMGVLQDIHWSWGAIGYFPTYAIGSLLAAQLYDGLENEVDLLADKIATGNFAPIVAWLREKVHCHGCLMPTSELITQASGQAFSAEPGKRRLAGRLRAIYGVEV